MRLSLIQVNDFEETFIIDCLKIGDYQNNCDFLFSKKVLKIFHSFREDIESIFSWTGKVLVNLFDTQLANAFLGGSYSIGYRNLVDEKLDVLVDKGETRSNWIKRPLRDSQLRYAASDVLYLIRLYKIQKGELDLTRKTDWFKEEISFICERMFSEANINVEESYNRAKTLDKDLERDFLIKFNRIIKKTSAYNNINSTLLLSKKNQADFLKLILVYGKKKAIEGLPKWKRDLILDDFHALITDFKFQ